MPAVAVIGVVAVFFLGMGVYALAAPAALVRPFGITLGESASRSEVRAVYGGFGLAIAGMLVYAVAADSDVRTGILITAASHWRGWRSAASPPRSWVIARRSIRTGSTSWSNSSPRRRCSGCPKGPPRRRRCAPGSP